MRRALPLGLVVAVGAVIAAWALRDRFSSSPDEPTESDATSAAKPPTLAVTAAPDAETVAGTTAKPASTEAGRDAAGPVSASSLRVLVTADGAPKPGATVRVRAAAPGAGAMVAATTDADGAATFPGVARDSVVEVRAEGFRVDVEERLGDTVSIHLGRGVPFDGRVLDARSGAPIAGASVVVRDWVDELEFGPTDAEGRFHVTGVMDDQGTTVRGRASGYAVTSMDVRIDSGKPQPAEPVLRLEKGGDVAGIVRSPDGAPVSGAMVHVWGGQEESIEEAVEPGEQQERFLESIEYFEYDDSVHRRGQGLSFLNVASGPDGSFRIEGLEIGRRYGLTASARGYASSVPVRGVEVGPEGQGQGVSLALRRSAVVLLRVVVPTPLDLPSDARVRLFREGVARQPDGVDPDGRFRFADVDPGVAHAFVQAAGFRSAAEKVVLGEGRTSQVELRLEAGASVEGLVTDGEGRALERVEVQVAPASQNPESRRRYLFGERETRTDAHGRFTIGGIAPGPVVLLADWFDPTSNRSFGTRGRIRLVAPARDVRVVVSRLGEIRMRLVTADGKPYTGYVWQYLIDENGSGGGGGPVTDGVVEDTMLDDGAYGFLVAPATHAWIRRDVEIRDGGFVDFGDVVLDPGVEVSGRVSDAAGMPIAGAKLECVENSNRSTVTDADGRFSFDRFPRERFSLSVEPDGFVAKTVVVEVGRATNLDVRLARPVRLTGVLKNPEGLLIEGSIELRKSGAQLIRHAVPGKEEEIEYYEGSEYLSADETGRFDATVPPGRWLAFWEDGAGGSHSLGEWVFADGEQREMVVVVPKK